MYKVINDLKINYMVLLLGKLFKKPDKKLLYFKYLERDKTAKLTKQEKHSNGYFLLK